MFFPVITVTGPVFCACESLPIFLRARHDFYIYYDLSSERPRSSSRKIYFDRQRAAAEHDLALTSFCLWFQVSPSAAFIASTIREMKGKFISILICDMIFVVSLRHSYIVLRYSQYSSQNRFNLGDNLEADYFLMSYKYKVHNPNFNCNSFVLCGETKLLLDCRSLG